MKDLFRLAGAWWLPAVVFLGLISAGLYFVTRIVGCFGITLAVIAVVLSAVGLMLLYRSNVDRLNVRYIQKYVIDQARPEDGAVIAVEGEAQVQGDPLRAPFSGQECAAYVYRVTKPKLRSQESSGKSSEVIARGHHLVPTEIVGPSISLSLGSLPSVEDDLRQTVNDGSWDEGWNRLAASHERSERNPGSPAIDGELLGLRQSVVREARHDYVRGSRVEIESKEDGDLLAEHAAEMNLDPEQRARLERVSASLERKWDDLTIEEEVVPAGETLCFIGKYDASSRSIDGTKARIGPNLIVYRGSGREVVERIGAEVRKWSRAGWIMVLIGAVILSMPFWPEAILESLPLIQLGESVK